MYVVLPGGFLYLGQNSSRASYSMDDSISIISVLDLSFNISSHLIFDRKHLISVQFALFRLKADNNGASL